MKKYILMIFLLGLQFFSIATFAQEKKNRVQKTTATPDIGKLTLRQKIGQLMLMLPDRKKELELGGGTLQGFFKRYPVTGFFMGWKLYDGIEPEKFYEYTRQACKDYQQASELPLIFQQDYESGVDFKEMVPFPNAMALGAANSPEMAYQYGKAIAAQCKDVGVNWVLHPVADLNINPFNPVTNVRSISDDADKAISLLSRQVRGLQENGVAATIKHFPGDGVDYRDQHLTTTSNFLPFNEWKQKHGKVFQALINDGVACIMPGHITLPAYQKQKINGQYLPASLSKELLTDLLKNEMKFKGVIVSDAMVMGGFRGWYKNQLEGEIESFKAGVDILLWPSYEFLDSVEARIQRGEISMERLNDAVNRAWNFKKRFGLLDKNRELIHPLTDAEKQRQQQLSLQISEQAVTLIRERFQALPLKPEKDKKILVVGLTPTSRKGGDGSLKGLQSFAEKLKNRGYAVDFVHNILYETNGWSENYSAQYDRIIVCTSKKMHDPFGPLQFWDDEAQTVWGINSMPKEKIILVNFGNPYNTNEYFERVNTCINAYSNSDLMHEAVIKVLEGKIPFKGISPLNLDVNSKFNFNK